MDAGAAGHNQMPELLSSVSARKYRGCALKYATAAALRVLVSLFKNRRTVQCYTTYAVIESKSK
jgi:hypothetical protein